MPKEISGPRLDKVKPKYVTDMKMAFCCEQCTHFDDVKTLCTFGFPVKPHLRKTQLEQMERTGEMAICRILEID